MPLAKIHLVQDRHDETWIALQEMGVVIPQQAMDPINGAASLTEKWYNRWRCVNKLALHRPGT